jgi:hypothetical protein
VRTSPGPTPVNARPRTLQIQEAARTRRAPSRPLAQFEPDPAPRFEPFVVWSRGRECQRDRHRRCHARALVALSGRPRRAARRGRSFRCSPARPIAKAPEPKRQHVDDAARRAEVRLHLGERAASPASPRPSAVPRRSSLVSRRRVAPGSRIAAAARERLWSPRAEPLRAARRGLPFLQGARWRRRRNRWASP